MWGREEEETGGGRGEEKEGREGGGEKGRRGGAERGVREGGGGEECGRHYKPHLCKSLQRIWKLLRGLKEDSAPESDCTPPGIQMNYSRTT